MLVVVQLILRVIKYFMLNLCMVMNNTTIFRNMISFFLRGPSSFYDITPVGLLTNKFTTDLGILDSALVIALIDSIEGPIIIGVALVNMIHISGWFAFPTVLLAIIILVYFFYARPAFIACKQMDLQIKAPIFHFYN